MHQKLMVEIDTYNELSQYKARIPVLESFDVEITDKLNDKR
jgi:hypothetical protein